MGRQEQEEKSGGHIGLYKGLGQPGIDPGPAAQIFLGKHIQYIYINIYKYSIVLT